MFFFQPHLQGRGGGESTPGLYRRRRTGKPVHRQQSSPVAVAAAVAGRRRRKISGRIQGIAADRRRRRRTGPQSWTCSRRDDGAGKLSFFGRRRHGDGWWQPCTVSLKPEPAGRVGAQRVQRSIPRLDRHGGAREPRLAAGQSHEHATQHRGARPTARVHL